MSLLAGPTFVASGCGHSTKPVRLLAIRKEFVMKVVPYLNFKGNCREAMEFYAELLRGKIVALFNFGDTPAASEVPDAAKDLVMHARLEFDGGVLMASDATEKDYETPAGIWVSLHPETPEEAERIFAGLAEGGTVVMPIGETFWAARFGMVNDRFGTPWMINCERRG